MARVSSKSSKTRTTAYDVAEHLRTPEAMAAYLDAWLETAIRITGLLQGKTP